EIRPVSAAFLVAALLWPAPLAIAATGEPVIAKAGDRRAARDRLLDDVAAGWRRPSPVAWDSTLTPEDPTLPMRRALEAVVLPEVAFFGADIGRVVSALGAAAEEFAPVGTTRMGINLALMDPSATPARVTITLRNISLKRALDLITQSIGYEYEVQA